MSPGRASRSANLIASPRSGTRQKVSPSLPLLDFAPAAISPRIPSSDSVRGSSAVNTVKSASSAEISAIIRRFSLSRKPAEPNTTIIRPFPPTVCPKALSSISRAVSSVTFNAFGVCAKSTMAVNSCPMSITSMRPGIPDRLAIPFAATSGSIPNPSMVALSAARQFETLYRPIRFTLMSTRSFGCSATNRIPCGL